VADEQPGVPLEDLVEVGVDAALVGEYPRRGVEDTPPHRLDHLDHVARSLLPAVRAHRIPAVERLAWPVDCAQPLGLGGELPHGG
jgi:hypothetical protein